MRRFSLIRPQFPRFPLVLGRVEKKLVCQLPEPGRRWIIGRELCECRRFAGQVSIAPGSAGKIV
jgi:hypothetical protein